MRFAVEKESARERRACIVCIMDSSGFGPAPMHLPVINPSDPMNMTYLAQAEAYARQNPNDAYAQRLYIHWMTGMQALHQARAQVPQSPTGPWTQGVQAPPQQASPPAPVPSNLLGTKTPTPPTSGQYLSRHLGGQPN